MRSATSQSPVPKPSREHRWRNRERCSTSPHEGEEHRTNGWTAKLSKSRSRIALREKRIAVAVGTSLLGQLSGIAATFLIIPLTITALGQAGYGLVLTLLAIPAALSGADLGIASAVVTRMASLSLPSTKIEDRRRLISNAFLTLCLISLVLAVTGTSAISLLEAYIGSLVQGKATPDDIRICTWLVLGAVVIGVPTGLGSRMLLAEQRGWISGVQSIGVNLVTLLLIFLATSAEPQLPMIVAASLAAPCLVPAAITIYALFFRGAALRPKMSLWNTAYSKDIFHAGMQFFLLNVAGTIAYQLDTILLTSLANPSETALYGIVARIFSFGPLIVGYALTPLWPAFSEAIAAGDRRWVRVTFKRSIIIAFGVNSLAAMACVTVSLVASSWLSNGAIQRFPPSLVVAFAAWTIINSLSGPTATLLNAAGVMRPQVLAALIMSGSNVALTVYLTPRFGASGPIAASVACQLLIALPISGVAAARLLRRLGEKQNKLEVRTVVAHSEEDFEKNEVLARVGPGIGGAPKCVF